MNKSKRIVVIAGGFSEEREVSLRSGKGVYKALEKLGYSDLEFFDLESIDSLAKLTQQHISKPYDLAVLLTHGKYGEDGCIQGFLELIKLPYTGSKLMQSAICMDKDRTKDILRSKGLSVLESARSIDEIEELVENEYILKPNAEGSSVGIHKFNTKKDLIDFIKKEKIDLNTHLVERFVKGTEVTTSIINYQESSKIKFKNDFSYLDKDLLSLPILELRPKNEFYDYEAKYTAGMTEFIMPCSLEENQQTKIHQSAIEAYRVLGLKGLARVDFIVEQSSKKPYILELNTLPGMTETSDAPAQALFADIAYDDLVGMIISSELDSANKLTKTK